MDANTELVCVMASLGYNDDDDYYMGDDCIESLRDCMRFLKKEDENCNIRRQMGAANLLQKDLLPMLTHLGDNEELIDIVIRLLVNLTSPADICFNKLGNEDEAIEEGAKKGKMTNTYLTKYNEVIAHLQKYKKEFTNEKTLASVGAQLGRILKIDVEDRTEDDLLLFERLLLLLRNILHVPSSPEDELMDYLITEHFFTGRTDDDASLHDQVLWSLHINGIDDLIIYVSSTPEEARWSMHIMEIINLMFREQNPETLAKSSEEKSEKEKAEIAKDMLQAKNREEAIYKASRKNVASTRHSRFGGSFWVQNMKGVGNTNTLVHHKLVNDPNDITFDEKKYPNRVAKRHQPLRDNEVEKRSTLKIRLFLKEFCKKFLENSYNPMMRQVKDSVLAKRTQENDDTYYIWGMRFFMMFNRAHSFKVEYVSETINMNAFHYILKQINNYYDQFLMNKRSGWEPWALRLHKAIHTYKELLTYIAHMDQSGDEVLQDASSVIKNNVFYHEEYRTIFLVLLRHYLVGRHTRKYLVDLVETFHLFLKLLEKFCNTKGSLLVKKKQKVAKKRKKTGGASTASRNVMSAEEMEELWENDLAPSLSGILQGYEDVSQNVLSPFDYESDVPVDEQRFNAKIRVQDLLRKGETSEAVALLRLSRECWPEEADFGSENMSPEDEFALYRNLLNMELERPAFEEPEEEENEIEDEEEEVASVRSVEREFHLKSFLQSLISPHIMLPYLIQLKLYRTSTPSTNHAVVKMMHRVAVEMKFPEMFFQLSTFIVFKEALEINLPEFKELNKFAAYIIYKFTEAAVENPSIYVDVLFLKTTGDCVQISGREPIRTAAAKAKWTTEEEIELKTLYDQHKEHEDIVGEIMKNMKEPRSRKKIINKLVDLQCVVSAADLPNPDKASGGTGNWTFEQEEELKALFEEYQHAEDVVGEILKKISNQDLTRRKITNKLVRLRLVENIKELPKPPRPSKAFAWTEEQTEELHRLYEEYKETEDVLLNILTTMTFKKSKNAIVRQLLETGKIDEESALCGKKQKKSGASSKKAFKAMLHQNDEPIYDDWSDEEPKSPSDRSTNGDEESGPSKSGSKQMKQMSEKRRRFGSDDESESESDISSCDSDDDDDVSSSSKSIPELVLTAKDEFPQQINWLQTRLRRAAEDREEDDEWYAMPLLTINEEDDKAMQDKNFKKLLVAIGLRPPVDEQEMFWRIDEDLSPEKLRNLADNLDKTGDDLKTSFVNEKVNKESSSMKKKKEKEKKKEKKKKEAISEEKRRPSKKDEDEANVKKKKLALKALMAKRNNRRFALSDDDSGDSDNDDNDNAKKHLETSKTEEANPTVQKSTKRRRVMLDNEDEDVDDLEKDGVNKSDENEKEESTEEKNPKRRRVMEDDDDSDDEDDDSENKEMTENKNSKEEVMKTKTKTKRILDDDESSDDDAAETMETQDVDDSVPLHRLIGDSTQTQQLQTQDVDDSVSLHKLLGEIAPSQKLSSLQTQDIDDSVPLHEVGKTHSDEKSSDDLNSQPVLRDTTNIVT